MNEVLIAIFSMDGCPHCKDFKKLLQKNKIPFSDIDIDEYSQEYDMFVQKVDGNEYVPAVMVIEIVDGKNKFYYYAPERDYNELEEAIEIIKDHRRNFDL